MKVKITPRRLSGTVAATASKSDAHRAIIAAALADSPTKIIINTTSKDIEATVNCIQALGATVEKNADGFTVNPIKSVTEGAVLNCGESGSTARFLIPVAAAIAKSAEFVGSGRLPQRPQKELVEAIAQGGADASSCFLPLTVYGRLHAGNYTISGSTSSQYITGLLLALSAVEGQSNILLTSPLQSSPYVDITLKVLERFGIKAHKTAEGYTVFGGGITSPGEYIVEGDWSNAAFWLVAAKTGCEITVSGLDPNSPQGDKAILTDMWMREIDASQIPDLVPILAVCAASVQGKTTIYNAQRLRIKESDRLKTVTENMRALGADITESEDGLVINGKGGLRGGVVSGCNDHRIVMAMAIAACISKNPVIIEGAEAVEKSYPTFFEDYKMLGGKVDVL